MEGSKGFSEIWQAAHRERSEFVWSILACLTPRRRAANTEQANEQQAIYGTLVRAR